MKPKKQNPVYDYWLDFHIPDDKIDLSESMEKELDEEQELKRKKVWR